MFVKLLLIYDIIELQSLAVVTLGDKQMAQRIDNLVDTEELKSFYLQVCYVICFSFWLMLVFDVLLSIKL